MGEVKQYYIMESAVKPMADGAPCCTPLVSAKTDLHTVPLVMGSDYDAMRTENDRHRYLWETELSRAKDAENSLFHSMLENADLVEALEAQSTFWNARLEELGCLSSEACEVKALVDAALAKHRGIESQTTCRKCRKKLKANRAETKNESTTSHRNAEKAPHRDADRENPSNSST